MLPACRELGIGFVPFSPLGRGFLSGTVKSLEGLPSSDFRRGLPRFQSGNLERNLELAKPVRTMASEKGCTPAQLALASGPRPGPDIVPIPGTKRPKYLEDNVGALEGTPIPGGARIARRPLRPRRVCRRAVSPFDRGARRPNPAPR